MFVPPNDPRWMKQSAADSMRDYLRIFVNSTVVALKSHFAGDVKTLIAYADNLEAMVTIERRGIEDVTLDVVCSGSNLTIRLEVGNRSLGRMALPFAASPTLVARFAWDLMKDAFIMDPHPQGREMVPISLLLTRPASA